MQFQQLNFIIFLGLKRIILENYFLKNSNFYIICLYMNNKI